MQLAWCSWPDVAGLAEAGGMRVANPQRRRDANPCGLSEATYNGVGEGEQARGEEAADVAGLV